MYYIFIYSEGIFNTYIKLGRYMNKKLQSKLKNYSIHLINMNKLLYHKKCLINNEK